MAQVLSRLNSIAPAELIVGATTRDDGAVWRLDERTAIVFTTDFFTPIVDDAYDWGRIAAANALSDVYAMGGRPLLCLNIVGWPREELPLDLLGRVLEGGEAVAQAAGAVVAGGHTIDDREPKYGMAVVGLADPERVITNAAARPGDRLVLTKPIGTGIVSTAIKRGAAPEQIVDETIGWMTTLNRDAADAMLVAGVIAATDVTGFGLLGHLHEMALASGVAAVVKDVPFIDGAQELAEAGNVPGGTKRNGKFLEEWVDWGSADDGRRTLLADAQTSGGLLIAATSSLAGELERRGVFWRVIGEIVEGTPGTIVVSKP